MCCLRSHILHKENPLSWTHEELKQVKKSETTLILDNGQRLKLTWNKTEKTFSAQERYSFCQAIANFCSSSSAQETLLINTANDVGEAMNTCAREDTSRRRADNYPLQTNNRREFQLLQASLTKKNGTLTVIHNQEERLWNPATAAPLGSAAPISSSIKKHPPIFLYGFEGNRKSLKDKLFSQFQFNQQCRFDFIDDYNRQLQFCSNMKFENYCDFLAAGRRGELRTQINSSRGFIPSEEIEAWTDHLQNNLGKLDFSRKVTDTKSSLEFVIKNSKRDDLVKIPGLESDLNRQNWNSISQRLRPITSLISRMNEPGNLSSLKADYAQLSREEKSLLDGILGTAFLRQTSKLGLSFAREKNIPVLFAWGVGTGEMSDLDTLQELLEAKPYKNEPPGFQENNHYEFITYSEKRELGRLLQQQAQAEAAGSSEKIAPDFLLISKINNEGWIAV